MSKVSSSLVLLGTMIVSSSATYILMKAKYDKLLCGKSNSIQKPAETGKKKESEKKNDISDKSEKLQEKGDLFDYAKKYNSKVNEALTSSYIQDQGENSVRQFVDEDIFQSSEYDGVNYTLWADGLLTDENDDIVKDPEENVGFEAVETFNEREVNGAVYILNHHNQMKYEILKDLRRYSEVFK